MKAWSVPLAIEAALCTGLHTLCAPLLLFGMLAPMVWWGFFAVLGLTASVAVALIAYWKLALATIERRPFRFGPAYWGGVAVVALAVVGAVTFLPKGEFWLLVLAPPILSGLHFSWLQARRQNTSFESVR